jgi:hypothetical protein
LQKGVGPLPQTAAKVEKQLVGLLKKTTPVVRVFAQKRLLPKQLEIGSPW